MGLRFGGWAAGGGKACDCSCSCTVCVRDCTGAAPGGAELAALDSGGNVVASGTADASGCAALAIPATGSYDVRVTIGSQVGYARGVTLACGGDVTLDANCCVEVDVIGCGGIAVPCAVAVAITDPATGDTLATGETDATGSAVLVLWTVPPTRTVEATATPPAGIGFAAASAQITLPSVCPDPPESTNTVAVTFGVDPGFVCVSGVVAPIPRHLTLTDANGSHAFDYCEPSGGTPGWYACDGPTVAGTIQFDEYCGTLPPSTGVCPVYYYGIGDTDASLNYIFQVQRRWRLEIHTSGGVSTVGYAGLDWDSYAYPPVQLPACDVDADGCHEIAGPPAEDPSCGFCTAGNEYTTSDGSAVFDPCQPFGVDIPTLAFPAAGQPIANACANQPAPADPVAGGVTIS